MLNKLSKEQKKEVKKEKEPVEEVKPEEEKVVEEKIKEEPEVLSEVSEDKKPVAEEAGAESPEEDSPEIKKRISELPDDLREFFTYIDPKTRRVICSDEGLLERSNEELEELYNIMLKELGGLIKEKRGKEAKEELGFKEVREQEERVFAKRALEETKKMEKTLRKKEDEIRKRFTDEGFLAYKEAYKLDVLLKLIEETSRNGHITTYDIVRSFEEGVEEARDKGVAFSLVKDFDKRLDKLVKEAPIIALNNSLDRVRKLREIEPENNAQKTEKNEKLVKWLWQLRRILTNNKEKMEKEDVEKYQEEISSIAAEVGVEELKI